MNVKISLRIPKSVKAKAAACARRKKESLNEWIGNRVRAGIEEESKRVDPTSGAKLFPGPVFDGEKQFHHAE